MIRCTHCGTPFEPQTEPLTLKQAAIFCFIESRIRATGVAPSLSEIAVEFRLSTSATVHEHLTKLERKGVLRRGSGPRNITLLVRSDELGEVPTIAVDDEEDA